MYLLPHLETKWHQSMAAMFPQFWTRNLLNLNVNKEENSWSYLFWEKKITVGNFFRNLYGKIRVKLMLVFKSYIPPPSPYRNEIFYNTLGVWDKALIWSGRQVFWTTSGKTFKREIVVEKHLVWWQYPINLGACRISPYHPFNL